MRSPVRRRSIAEPIGILYVNRFFESKRGFGNGHRECPAVLGVSERGKAAGSTPSNRIDAPGCPVLSGFRIATVLPSGATAAFRTISGPLSTVAWPVSTFWINKRSGCFAVAAPAVSQKEAVYGQPGVLQVRRAQLELRGFHGDMPDRIESVPVHRLRRWVT